MLCRSLTLSWLALTSALPCVAQSSPEQRAQPASVITVQRGASCLDAERFVAHVNMWLEGGAPPADLRVIVIGDTTNRQATTFEPQRGSRVRKRDFRAAPKSCDELHAALGLAIALAIDAERIQQLWLAPPEFEPRWLGSLLVSGSYGLPLDAALGSQARLEVWWSSWFSTRIDRMTHVLPITIRRARARARTRTLPRPRSRERQPRRRGAAATRGGEPQPRDLPTTPSSRSPLQP